LVATLEFVPEALAECDANWSARFRREWAALEEVNAVVVDEGRTTFTKDEQQLLNQTAGELKALIEVARRLPNE
jgi:hypothetical protein